MPNPPRKMKLSPGPGQPAKDVESVEVRNSAEPWTQIDLADGSTIKLRSVVSEVWRVTGEYDAEGNPIYIVKHQTIMNVTPAELLTKKGVH
jgi:hypothetical protein